MRLRTSHERGSILATVLVISALLTLSLVTYLTFVSGQHKLAVRSQSWNGALVMAESGIEEALTHINFPGTTNFADDGWTLSGAAYRKTRTLGDGYFSVALSTSLPPTIYSTGFVTAPLGGSYVARGVRVVTTNVARMKGLLARTSISMSGGARVDSFDSEVTGGQYDAAQATDKAYVAVASSAAGALKVTAVCGEVATGAGGSVTISGDGIGDEDWVDGAPGTVQPGHFKDDLNVTIPDVPEPFTSGYFTPTGGTVNGTNYAYVLTGGDYKLPSCSLTSGKYALVQGKNRWIVDGDCTVNVGAWVLLEPGATLELYVGGKVTVLGSGFINSSQKASSLSLYGLPTCKSINLNGTSLFTGIVRAPAAKLTISGAGGASGSAIANQIVISGGANYHCDTALYGPAGGAYLIISWNEP